MHYYGITRKSQVREIAEDVCDVLGHGANAAAVDLLVRTCAQETGLGTVKDRHWRVAGVGLMQIDQIPFYDVIRRARDVDIFNVKVAFGIDLGTVTHEESAFSPLISMIVARLYYKLIPAPIPSSLEAQAMYWKHHYNSELGKGTAAEFIKNAKFYGV